MKNILMIEVSPRGKDSASRVVSNKLAERLADIYPGPKILLWVANRTATSGILSA